MFKITAKNIKLNIFSGSIKLTESQKQSITLF